MPSKKSPIYSFVVPIFNDGYLVSAFLAEFRKQMSEYLKGDNLDEQLELLFIDDGSSSESKKLLIQSIDRYSFVKCIFLSRNFGQHIAISCGYKHAVGKFVIMLNVDQQDPIDQIPILLDIVKRGEFDIVCGLRRSHAGSLIEKNFSRFFTFLLNKLTRYDIPLNASTLRVMNRKFIDAYNQLLESSRYLPGLEKWLGFKHSYVEISHKKRESGRSSYTFIRKVYLGVGAVISFSDVPLKIVVMIGFFVTLIGFCLIIFYILNKFFITDVVLGYTSTIAAIIFFGGFQLFVTGIASLYIGRILKETQRRPLYLIQEMHNF